jgi:hypothetical protein
LVTTQAPMMMRSCGFSSTFSAMAVVLPLKWSVPERTVAPFAAQNVAGGRGPVRASRYALAAILSHRG